MDKKFYTLDEAEKLGLKWVYWRDITVRDGDWVRTDDDYVVYVRRAFHGSRWNGTETYMINTPFKTLSQTRKEPFHLQKIIENVRILNNYGQGYVSKRDYALADLLIAGYDPVDAAYQIYPGLSSKEVARKIVKRVLRKKEILKYMGNKMKQALIDAGLTENYLADNLKALIESSTRENAKLEAMKLAISILTHQESKKREQVIDLTYSDYELLEDNSDHTALPEYDSPLESSTE